MSLVLISGSFTSFIFCNNVLYPEEPVGIVSLTEPDVCSSGKVHRWHLHNPFINSETSRNKTCIDSSKQQNHLCKSFFSRHSPVAVNVEHQLGGTERQRDFVPVSICQTVGENLSLLPLVWTLEVEADLIAQTAALQLQKPVEKTHQMRVRKLLVH